MAAPIFAASGRVVTVEFVPAPEWTLHFCAVACSDVIPFGSLFTACPREPVAMAHRTCRGLDGRFTTVRERQV